MAVDKLAKIGENGVKEEIKALDISNQSLDKLFNYFKMENSELLNAFDNTTNSQLKEGIEEIKMLNDYIERFNLKECVFTPYLARGLDIYTGTIWEVFDKERRITSSIGAGGRYDKIITNFINDGNSYPAVGMTFGLVPIFEIISKNDSDVFYQLYIIPMGKEFECLKLATDLRKKEIKTIIEMNNKKVKKAFEWANKNNIPFTIVIGENEINTGKIKIKDMNSYKEIEVEINDIQKICEIINR